MTVGGIGLRVPQLMTLLRTQDVSGVSATTWVLSGITATAWLIPSIARGATPVIIANATSIAATATLLIVLWIKRKMPASSEASG